MTKKPTKPKSEARKPRDHEPAEKPVSLKPLTVEEALQGLIEVSPQRHSKEDK